MLRFPPLICPFPPYCAENTVFLAYFVCIRRVSQGVFRRGGHYTEYAANTLEARVFFEGGGGAFTSGEIRAEYEHQYDPNTQSNTRIFGIGVYL